MKAMALLNRAGPLHLSQCSHTGLGFTLTVYGLVVPLFVRYLAALFHNPFSTQSLSIDFSTTQVLTR